MEVMWYSGSGKKWVFNDLSRMKNGVINWICVVYCNRGCCDE